MRRSNLLFAVAKRLWKAIEADRSPRSPSSTVKSPGSQSSLVGAEDGTCTEVTGTEELFTEATGTRDFCSEHGLADTCGAAFFEADTFDGRLATFDDFVGFAFDLFAIFRVLRINSMDALRLDCGVYCGSAHRGTVVRRIHPFCVVDVCTEFP